MHFQTVNLFNSPRFIRRPLLFAEQTRIKRKPPKEESEDNKPGCATLNYEVTVE